MPSPGLNPSLRPYGPGSIGVFETFRGIAPAWKSTRRPVALEESATV
jgi:hypothetical protein